MKKEKILITRYWVEAKRLGQWNVLALCDTLQQAKDYLLNPLSVEYTEVRIVKVVKSEVNPEDLL